ncbi:MAG: hypothetical protein AB1817_08565 [Chloroflexota bacterium]
MDEQVATAFVIRELAKHRNRNDIILSLCQHDELNWEQAEAFVTRVEQTHRRKIAGGQATILIVMGLGIMVAGLYLATRYTVATLNGAIIFQWPLPVPYLGNVTRIGAGVVMVIAGFAGILKVVWDMLS